MFWEPKFKDEWANWTRVQRRATEYFCTENMPYKEGCCLNMRKLKERHSNLEITVKRKGVKLLSIQWRKDKE